ncbi:MAG: DUF5060 domain-containing protein [Victivallaceae bacterium]
MRYFEKTLFAVALTVFICCFEGWSFDKADWVLEKSGLPGEKLVPGSDGSVTVTLSLPGSALIYKQKDRQTLRQEKDFFQKKTFSIEVKAESVSKVPISAVIFIKDKDGLWFQTRREYKIIPGEWQRLEADIAGGSALIPVGHNGTWSGLHQMVMIDAGISIYGNSPAQFKFLCRKLEFSGIRTQPPLQLFNWKMPDAAGRYEIIQSDFELSREYCNPFDPDEICVDAEAVCPDGRTIRWPAFYTQNFIRQNHFTREITIPSGKAYWAFRFTPEQTGEYRLRLVIEDKSGKTAELLVSPWKNLYVQNSASKGYVRPSSRNKRYFEFSTGEFFFPVGINIHTNIDLRSERQFKFGHLPDRGTYDYDEYLAAMAQAGINAVEIWMASWSFALEWSISQPFYYGLGRYNLANASRLDHVLNDAREKDIYVHLTLDNHGKLSRTSDQEWDDNPFNAKNPFAYSNGGFLKEPEDFFADPQARKLNRQRNRYIAGRWGAYTNIFGIEFWSEVNLVSNFKPVYDNGVCTEWHKEAAADFAAMDQGKHMMTTHYCGSCSEQIKLPALIEIPEFAYIAGDAYRNVNIHFVDLMRQHEAVLGVFNRPLLVTEFGGTSSGGKAELVVGDIHSGVWSSFFKQQAGTPFLWWHDFIHLNNHYRHYKGFSEYIKDIDMPDNNMQFKELDVTDPAAPRPHPEYVPPPPPAIAMRVLQWNLKDYYLAYINGLRLPVEKCLNNYFGRKNYFVECFSAGNASTVYGWVFSRQHIHCYPEKEDALPLLKNLKITLDYPLPAGTYSLKFYDTISGKMIYGRDIQVNNSPPEIQVPPFKIDVAFKLKRKFFCSESDAAAPKIMDRKR